MLHKTWILYLTLNSHNCLDKYQFSSTSTCEMSNPHDGQFTVLFGQISRCWANSRWYVQRKATPQPSYRIVEGDSLKLIWGQAAASTKKSDWGRASHCFPANYTFNHKIANKCASQRGPVSWTTAVINLTPSNTLLAEWMPIWTSDGLIENTKTEMKQEINNA